MVFDREAPVPLHYQITNDLREAIKSGKWGVGDLFPTDKELMEMYGVSSTTVRRAVAELVREGWLERKRGKGTFVKKEAIEETLGRLTGFFEEIRSHGHIPSADVLDLRPVEITDKEIEKTPLLSVFKHQKLFLIERLQKMDGNPVVYLRSYWPYEYGKRMAEFDLSKEALYEIAEKKLGLILTRAEQTISAGVARKKEAQLLSVPVGFPLLIMERLAYAGDQPVELSINAYRADRYKYRVILRKDYQNVSGILLP
ncbi:transcriptional regulator, GntR family [Thermanaeromonas toyohensis ToBE]|uniref:Transcriptional regulator, GntR family n=1 Tax=Thermanaeromonas toyohensis ToBE TaxID=698762 RepID=A0A1W1VV68_9FIRM|nr:GntR family transcriptional regulator [Thermanaeromonas toyohensis]SMB97282.1 transcriptional regulator, GntR family [Thermanaeromonas toyohensis ToBE]